MPVTATTISPGPATGYYTDEQAVRDIFGSDNVTRWSQLDNSLTTADENRIQRALAYADAEINLMMSNGPYAVPLVISNGRAIVSTWAAVIAGIWLFRSKGGNADAATLARYDEMLLGTYDGLRRCVAGRVMLQAARRWPAPTGPVAV
jgi:phage gp36-like protein